MILDTIIIGGGPSALSAAIYAARQKLNFVLIAENIGGQILLSSDIENYLGFKSITGVELIPKFLEQIEHNNVKIIEEKVIDIKKNKNIFTIITNSNTYQSSTVLIASGKKPRKLNVPGENEFTKKGISYCAICDAALFREKDVAIIGGGNAAMDAALLLRRYANKVFIVSINNDLIGETTMIEQIKNDSQINFIGGSRIEQITGSEFVDGISILVDKNQKTIPVQGVFIEIGSVPSVDFDKLTKKNRYNEIIIHEKNTFSNMTSVNGIFAAGDVTNVQEKQIVVAAGEGAKAILSIIKYLNRNIKGGY